MGHLLKLAQKGYDVHTAGDENLTFSSQWPLLPIYAQGSFSFDTTQPIDIFEHKLGYYPAFWFFSNSAIGGYENSGLQTNDSRSEFFGPVGNGTIRVNQNKMYFQPGGGTLGTISIYYYIFLLDLKKAFSAPINKVGEVAAGSSGGHVFKLAKPNKDVDSHRLEDFIIHSDTRSPLVHSVQPTPVGSDYSFPHNLGYNPMFFTYNFAGNYYTLLPTGSSNNYSLNSDTQQVHFSQTSTNIAELSTLILKDPFLVSYSRSVVV